MSEGSGKEQEGWQDPDMSHTSESDIKMDPQAGTEEGQPEEEESAPNTQAQAQPGGF